MRSALVALCVSLIGSACGSNSSPSAPGAPSTPTKVISITGSRGFGNVTLGQTRSGSITINNSGTATMTVTRCNSNRAIRDRSDDEI
jgi:hypothetical protein